MKISETARHSFERTSEGTWFFSIMEAPTNGSIGERHQGSLRESSQDELSVAEAMGREFLAEAIKRRQYLDYLASPEWRELRRRVLEMADGCTVCTSMNALDVHHRSYARFGHEELADLIVLCRECHTVFHRNHRIS